MMRQLQQIVVGILLASSLLLHCSQRCDAAAPFSLSSRRAIVPHLSQHDASEDITKNTSSSITSLGDDEDDYNLKTRSSSSSYKRLKFLRGGNNILLLSSSSSPLLSTITTIVAQTLNVAIASIVGSGYLGCYIASLIITRLQQYCQLSDDNNTNNNGSNNIVLSLLLQGKWKWTILASISHILINNFQNPSFVPTLWIYSYMVNSTLGGLIGCTHVLLGGISSVLGSQVVINRVSDLMDVRLPPLDEDGNMSYDVNTFLKSREESKSVVIRDGLVRFLSSLSILTSFPQDCLSLYLGISAFLSWASTVDLSNNVGMLWKVVSEKLIPWWSDGLFRKDGGGGAAAAATTMVVDTKTLSMRLFALHLIIMLVKGMTALLLQL